MKKKSGFSRLRKAIAMALVFWMTLSGLAVFPAGSGMAAGASENAAASTDETSGIGFWLTFDLPNFIAETLGISIDTAGFAKTIKAIQEVISVINSIIKLINDVFGEIFAALGSVIQGVLGGKRLEGELAKRMADAKISADFNDQKLALEMDAVMNNARPKNAHLCRKIVGSQFSRSLEDYKNGVARSIVDAIRFRQRGPGRDGAGPRGTIQATEMRCLNKYGNPIDGYPDSCVDTTTSIPPFGRKLTDADLLAATMDGSVTLEYPHRDVVSEQTQNGQTLLVARAVLQNDNQRMWLAAVNYCMQMAGPRPTPPTGAQAKTPNGMVLTSLFNHGTARESAYADKCAKVVAYHTRPNPTDSPDIVQQHEELCAKSVKGVMGKTNYIPEETLIEKFGNCKIGLSPYQIDYLQALTCKTPQYFMLSSNSGVLYPEMMDDAMTCGSAWNTWQLNMATLHGGLVDAVKGFMGNRKLWNKMLDRSLGQNNAENNMAPPAARQASSPSAEQATKAPKQKLHRINDTQMVPVTTDQTGLPLAVEQ